MPVQDDQQVDNNALYALIHQLQSDLTSKIDGLSGQVNNIRLLVTEGQSAYNAHNLPKRVDELSGRITAIEIANAGERELPAKVEDHEKRIKDVEKIEQERVGRRKLLDSLAVFGALLGGIATIIQIYQWLKGR